MRVPRQTTFQIFRWPLLIALASLAALILGLTGDGWRDTIAVLLLLLPLAVLVAGWRRRT